MNHITAITAHSEQLPEHLQKEVLDFICFLEDRYLSQSKTPQNNELTDADIEQACGVLTASKGLSV